MKWWQVLEMQLREEAGDDGDKGGGSGDNKTISPEEYERLKQSVDKLTQKNQELLGENSKYKNTLKDWEGLDASQVKNMMKQFEDSEEMKLIAEGKHDEVIKKRTERVVSEYQSKLDAAVNEKQTLAQELETTKSQVQKLLIDNNAVTSFLKVGGLESAVDDVIARAARLFKVENGEPIPRDKDGNIVRGKNGIMTMQEWAEGLRENAPHLFPQSSESFANGSKSKTGATGIDAQIEAARKAGNVNLLRELQNKKRKMLSKED